MFNKHDALKWEDRDRFKLFELHQCFSNHDIRKAYIFRCGWQEVQHTKNLCISVVYVPPKANITVAIENLDQLGNLVNSKELEWILGGDLNIDISPGINSNYKGLLNNFALRNSIEQLIKRPTRFSKNRASIIDHIYYNKTDNLDKSGVVPYGLSDHYLTFLSLKRNLPKKDKINFECRKMKNYDRNVLFELINTQDYSLFYESRDPAASWEILYQIYLNCLNSVAPLITVYNIKEIDPWVSQELIDLVRERDSEKMKCDKLFNNNACIEFRKLRNKVKRTVIKAKHNYIRGCMKELNPSSKKFWSEVNKIAPLSRKKTRDKQSLKSLTVNGSVLSGEELANHFNDYFASVGPLLSSKILTDNTMYIENCKKCLSPTALDSWEIITETEVEVMVELLDTSKNSNTTGINAFLLQECLLCSIPEITHLFNLVCTSCLFPDCWKEATVIPLY